MSFLSVSVGLQCAYYHLSEITCTALTSPNKAAVYSLHYSMCSTPIYRILHLGGGHFFGDSKHVCETDVVQIMPF